MESAMQHSKNMDSSNFRISILSTPSWFTLSIALIDAALSTIHAYRMHRGVSNDYN